MMRIEAPDEPDYSTLLRQRALDDVLADLLEDTFRATNAHVTYYNGAPHSLVVDKTTDGYVRATLYRDDEQVAVVRLDYTVEVTP